MRNAKAADKLEGGGGGSVSAGGRLLRELKLEVPIRYSAGDKIGEASFRPHTLVAEGRIH